MKKIFILLFIFCSFSVYSQTWTETSSFGGKHTEWTVITRDDWNRLRKQNEEDNNFVELIYTDAFEMKTGNVNRVLSGTRPNFNGYYFLYGKWYGFVGGWELILAYGNSNTGRMEIRYPQYASDFMNFRAGSNDYWNLYNRFVRRVNVETSEPAKPDIPSAIITENIVIEGIGQLTYSLSNSLDEIENAIFIRSGKRVKLTNVNWSLNTSNLSQNVKTVMNRHNVNYSMTIYLDSVVVNKRDGNQWYIFYP